MSAIVLRKQYVTDEDGNQIGVILPIADYLVIEPLLRLRKSKPESVQAQRQKRMTRAAEIMQEEYAIDTELTAFTALDGKSLWSRILKSNCWYSSPHTRHEVFWNQNMEERYLEVTFRKGRPFAAYYYLPRAPGEKSVRTEKAGVGFLVDYGSSGRPIGIEITAPKEISLGAINDILATLNLHPAEQNDFAPLLAA